MLSIKTIENNITSLSKSVIRTLAYYDIFNYPLTIEEIFDLLDRNSIGIEDIRKEISLLLSHNIIFQKNDYYLLNPDYSRVANRIEGNERAQKRMRTARKFSKLISMFPYVRAVFLSGSISKGYLDKKADIDYFIVTKENRLWISKFLLTLFKKIFLLNSYKNFCINYFISEKNLEIEEKNIYTATELATLIPVYGSLVYDEFYSANKWIKNYFPNYPKRNTAKISMGGVRFTQRIIESLINNKFGDRLDDYFMDLFLSFDRKKYGNLDENTFKVAFKTRKNVSKHHPNYFQQRVLTALQSKIKQLESAHNIILN